MLGVGLLGVVMIALNLQLLSTRQNNTEGMKAQDCGIDWAPLPQNASWTISDRFRTEVRNKMLEYSTPDGVILLTSFSVGYTDMVFNTILNLKYFGLDRHVVFICEDRNSWKSLEEYEYAEQAVISDIGLSRSAGKTGKFGEDSYWSLTMPRPWYMTFGLEAGVKVIWIDPDIFFVKNIVEEFKNLKPDLESGFILERDHNRYICSGIIFFAPTCNNRVLVREWQIEMIKRGDGLDQSALQQALKNIGGFQNRSDWKVGFIDMKKGCSGWTFWKDRSCFYDQLIFAHANWITGRVAKVKRLECSKMWLLPCYLDASPSQILFFNLSDTSRCQGFDFFEKPLESVVAVHKGASVKECPLPEIL